MRETYGHSLAVDPWGTVIADAGDPVGVTFVDIDPAEALAARRRIPSLAHDRAYTAPPHEREPSATPWSSRSSARS